MDSVDPYGGNGASERDAGEGDEVEASEHVEPSLVVADQAAEAGLPSEGAFNDPATLPMRRFSSAVGCGIDGVVLS
jgi:hypothetical protein